MRTILISLILVMFTRVVYGDAVIFSGNDVKALKQNLDLFGTSKLMGTASDPSSGGGLAAPLSSIAMNYLTGIAYIKTSAHNTGWSRIIDTSYAPGVYFKQSGNAFGATATLGTTDANRLDFITGGAIGMTLTTAGRLGVGTSTPGYRLTVNEGPADPATTSAAIRASQTSSITATNGNGLYGIYTNVQPTISASQTLASTNGYYSDVSLTGGAGTLTAEYGMRSLYGVKTGSTATVTSAYGLNIVPYHQAGTITNSYGILLSTATTGGTATNYWALYQQDSTAKNYFAGNVGIGNASPAATLDVTGTQLITSTSASSLVVGPNGTTNPVLQVDSSVASSANGIKITPSAAASGVTIGTISSAGSDSLLLAAKGTGFVALQSSGNSRIQATSVGAIFTPGISTAGTARFLFTGAADTAISASTESHDVHFNMAQTRINSTGALALQRDFRISPTTHAFVGASTLTDAAAFSIDGPSNGGTNATITNSHGIYIPTSTLTNVTNSYGLSINATTGATNNYAAQFMGGNVGVGISAPTNKIHQDSGTGTASYHQFTANATTGQASTDGTLIGIDASGNAIFNNQEAAYINFLSSNTQRARITALGSLVVGNNSSALATNATDGFLYISSSAGAPTGTPTTQTGSVPIHVDSTNNAMYMYTNGAWRGANNSAVQGSRQTGTSMSAATAITPALGVKSVVFVVGNGGAITITASPPITTTGMIVGQELRVCGTSNTNTVTYNNSVNLVLTGSATLGKDQCLDLMFSGTDGTNLSWIETGRSF